MALADAEPVTRPTHGRVEPAWSRGLHRAWIAAVVAFFVRRRGVVSGVLTPGESTGQVIFLPLLAALVDTSGWRAAAPTVAGAALLVVRS